MVLVSGVQQWFDTFIHYEMIAMIILVTVCPHTEFLQNYSLYSLCYTLHPCDLFIL